MEKLNKHRDSRGFTLIEVLIALVILSIGLLGLWSLHISTIRSRVFSYKMYKATKIAENKMEEEKVKSNLSNGTSQETVEGFRVYCKVEDDPLGSPSKKVTVKVGWGGNGCLSDIYNCKHKVELTSLIPTS